jgi:predicted GH43/DUF377 family glycosyl hydrolase
MNKLIYMFFFSFVLVFYQATIFSELNHVSINELISEHSPFVLETKRIDIPGYSHIFNPSIIKWKDAFLMSFRINNDDTYSTKKIGLILLDKNFNIKSKPYILQIRHEKKQCVFLHKNSRMHEQDTRLITVNNSLYMVYSHFKIGRMLTAKVYFDGNNFFLNKPECLLYFDDANKTRIEKNWVPFQYNNNLLLAYSISPHKILLPIQGTEACKTYSYSPDLIDWAYGQLRGGTPALFVDGKYLAFFHSSLDIKNANPQGQEIRYYFMGAYMFEPKPPFNITHISARPIIGKDFYGGTQYKTWRPLRCIFPAGFIFDENYIWVSYGKQDHECWLVKLDKKKLIKSLKAVKCSLKKV